MSAPQQFVRSRVRALSALLASVILLPAFAAASVDPSCVAVLQSNAWSPGDHVRDAAGEFSIYLRAAQLQRSHDAVGLVAVGDRNGMLRSGGERALRRLVVSGVVIVKLAPGGEVAPSDDVDLFLDGSTVPPEQLANLLAACLQRHGAPPSAAEPERPTAAEKRAIADHLRPFHAAIAAARTKSLASTSARR